MGSYRPAFGIGRLAVGAVNNAANQSAGWDSCHMKSRRRTALLEGKAHCEKLAGLQACGLRVGPRQSRGLRTGYGSRFARTGEEDHEARAPIQVFPSQASVRTVQLGWVVPT